MERARLGEATLVKTTLLFVFAAALIAMLPQSTAGAEEAGATWVSVPRSLVKIAVGQGGGRVTGPGWEHRFEATARTLDFEIAPQRRFVLRRSGDTWVGEYFHPRIRQGSHAREVHKMTFTCGSGVCRNGR
jgi:hypothetical protein